MNAACSSSVIVRPSRASASCRTWSMRRPLSAALHVAVRELGHPQGDVVTTCWA